MRKPITLLLSLVFVSMLAAQNMSVSEFRLKENDMTANLQESMVKDQNGEVCALIRLQTTEQGFVFEGGMVGIMKVVPKTAEIWVYVPHGIKRITLRHQQLGSFEYDFPIPIEKARTYEMKLITAQVQTVTNVPVQQQFVIFQVNPVDAMVVLNEEALLVDEQGIASKRLPYGKYSYHVSSANYHTESGEVEINAEGKTLVNVNLAPNYGWIDIASDTEYHGAYVYLNNERVGRVPMKTDALKSGVYHLSFIKPLYKTHEQEVLVKDNETSYIQLEMQTNVASVTFQVAAETEVWLEGERLGYGPQQLRLELGQYNVETKRDSHQGSSQLIQINSSEAQTIVLNEPVPLYGSLEVNTSPKMANVYLDDKLIGETPLLINEVLIGDYELRIEKEGYATQTKSVMVTHNQVESFEQILYEQSENNNNFENGYEWVDLGLSVKWATCNIGAASPEACGDYFSWGEVKPKDRYNWASYKYCIGSHKTQTKYCTNRAYGYNGFLDDKVTLDKVDDVAHVSWGGRWRMPTNKEQVELVNNCTWAWVTQNGVNGYKVTSMINGNSIFLPAAGYCYGSKHSKVGTSAYYWSGSLYDACSSGAYYLFFKLNDVTLSLNNRNYGYSVRPVCP